MTTKGIAKSIVSVGFNECESNKLDQWMNETEHCDVRTTYL